jgi:cytochrome bd-type quinol oxidase subunit 1
MELDAVFLSRLQFAFTIMFHYLFPPLSIGLGFMMVIMEGMYLKTGNREYESIARFLTGIFAVVFAMGVASGIVSSVHRLVHVWLAALVLGAFFLLSISSYYILKNRHEGPAKKMFTLALWIMAIFAFLGMPFVLAYTTVIYWTFRGKVQMGTSSY